MIDKARRNWMQCFPFSPFHLPTWTPLLSFLFLLPGAVIRSLEGGLSPCLLATHGRTCWAVTLCWTSLERWRRPATSADLLSPQLSTPSLLKGTEASSRALTWICKSPNLPAPPLVALSPSSLFFFQHSVLSSSHFSVQQDPSCSRHPGPYLSTTEFASRIQQSPSR